MNEQNYSFDKYKILSKVNTPNDIKSLSYDDIILLNNEIRSMLIERVSENGGHLASNLGVVELSVALHKCFNSPHDHIIWDVGHQSYTHKILTGRKERFDTLRLSGGLSGFTKISESEYDCFGAGHSSTALSAALGFAKSDKLKGSDAYSVAIVGDGAYTGGMVHEALNNCEKNLRLIIVLNENEMSISKNIGRFAKNLSKLRSTQGYFKTKNATRNIISKIPLIGKYLFKAVQSLKQSLKNAMYGSNYFENLGFYYLGPVDGNDYEQVENLLTEAKNANQSCVIHLKTKKGKGYVPAEQSPSLYHGVSPKTVSKPVEDTFSEKFGEYLTSLAKEDKTICAITAAMAEGTGLIQFKKAHQKRFFDVGIAEAHAATFAAGLAANGMKPFFAVYSTFMQRCYDNIIHDIALQNLPVVLCVDRSGLNCHDGATHHGIFDVAFLSEIPNMKIYTPPTYECLYRAVDDSIKSACPCAIRYPNGGENQKVIDSFYGNGVPLNIGIRTDFADDRRLDAIIITHGKIINEALVAKEKIMETAGKNVGIILLEYLEPYDKLAEEIEAVLPKYSVKVLYLEEEIKNGGMGMILSQKLEQYPKMKNKHNIIMAVEDNFVIQTKDEPIYKTAGVSYYDIIEKLDII
ncbi:MAG: 1-deoxy-D-xylulose-5-phosphate synthase [Methanomethylophilus sp.]